MDDITVREAIKAATDGSDWYADDIPTRLGIDPDMSLETLKRRLLWGERLEEVTEVDPGQGTYLGVSYLLHLLTRDDES